MSALLHELMSLDPLQHKDAATLALRQDEALALVEELAATGDIEAACELGLQIELALESLGLAPDATAAPGPPGTTSTQRQSIVARLLELARAAGHAFYEVELLLRRAELCQSPAGTEQATALYETALARARAAELPMLEAMALGGLAQQAQAEGNSFKAHLFYGKQHQCAERAGSPMIAAQAASNLSATALALSEFHRASRYAREAQRLFRELEDQHGEAEALCNLGLSQRHLGQHAASQESYRRALLLCRAIEHPALEAAGCYNLAALLLGSNDELAACLLQRAATLWENNGAPELSEQAARAAALLPRGTQGDRADADQRIAAFLTQVCEQS